MCPFSSSLPPGEGPERFSPSSVTDWQPRRKSVSNACERCRRRKIRCDGNTPCATCNRFSLPCHRSQKPREVVASEHQAALESRIHQLEAQLAAHVNTPMHGMESIDQTVMAGASSSNYDWQSPPPLTLDTNFSTPYSPENDLDLGSFSAGRMPSIAITECEPALFCASPSSPVPSFWSDSSTRPSSPEQPPPTSAPKQSKPLPNLAPPSRTQTFSPPIAPHNAPSWEFMAGEGSRQLAPQDVNSQNVSRRTSESSLDQESDEDDESDVDMLPLAPTPHLPRQGIFAAHTESPPPGMSRSSFTDRSRAMTITPFPSRFEAETLTAEFVQHIESLKYKAYSINPSVFGKFCETVYPDPANRGSTPVDPTVSIPMARFHVFMAMAIGMKVRIKESLAPTNSVLDTCYELAMQQATSVTFWQERGAVEAAQLLTLFASIQKELNFEPRPIHTSSW
ncbi:hypothetical protein K504DRAFT_468217 [Pleomassaria siparia CBS 279.74]|uniref:Zn(2)-C6 fungal-type domain-containing protein n=1 Tax=Pleomassaria siparia CBS 279.74 TaxID=1314801 RepID=A0A6G1K983_9PLEO|nr:hypothetical protein K504DRAFT_468217 [Pleomassaria siparia CBS 279.74]